jgi:hypothetical protein
MGDADFHKGNIRLPSSRPARSTSCPRCSAEHNPPSCSSRLYSRSLRCAAAALRPPFSRPSLPRRQRGRAAPVCCSSATSARPITRTSGSGASAERPTLCCLLTLPARRRAWTLVQAKALGSPHPSSSSIQPRTSATSTKAASTRRERRCPVFRRPVCWCCPWSCRGQASSLHSSASRPRTEVCRRSRGGAQAPVPMAAACGPRTTRTASFSCWRCGRLPLPWPQRCWQQHSARRRRRMRRCLPRRPLPWLPRSLPCPAHRVPSAPSSCRCCEPPRRRADRRSTGGGPGRRGRGTQRGRREGSEGDCHGHSHGGGHDGHDAPHGGEGRRRRRGRGGLEARHLELTIPPFYLPSQLEKAQSYDDASGVVGVKRACKFQVPFQCPPPTNPALRLFRWLPPSPPALPCPPCPSRRRLCRLRRHPRQFPRGVNPPHRLHPRRRLV